MKFLKIVFVVLTLMVTIYIVMRFMPTKVVYARGYELPRTPQEAVMTYSALYGADYSDLKRVMECESGGKIDKKGDNGLAYGILQFHKGTFERFAKQMGEELDYYSWLDQAKVGAWAFAQTDAYRNQWSTYVALKNGGIYKFYSHLLKKNFTVKCSVV